MVSKSEDKTRKQLEEIEAGKSKLPCKPMSSSKKKSNAHMSTAIKLAKGDLCRVETDHRELKYFFEGASKAPPLRRKRPAPLTGLSSHRNLAIASSTRSVAGSSAKLSSVHYGSVRGLNRLKVNQRLPWLTRQQPKKVQSAAVIR